MAFIWVFYSSRAVANECIRKIVTLIMIAVLWRMDNPIIPYPINTPTNDYFFLTLCAAWGNFAGRLPVSFISHWLPAPGLSNHQTINWWRESPFKSLTKMMRRFVIFCTTPDPLNKIQLTIVLLKSNFHLGRGNFIHTKNVGRLINPLVHLV